MRVNDAGRPNPHLDVRAAASACAGHNIRDRILIEPTRGSVTINGKTTVIDPGGAAFVHSGELHGVRNPGTMPAQYFVVAIGT